MNLDAREIASLILLAALGFALLASRTTRRSLRGLAKDLLAPKVLLPALGLIASVAVLVVLGVRIDAWESALLLPTIAWVVGPGGALLYRVATRKPGEAFVRPALRRALALTGVVELFVGLYVFGLLAELVLLLFLGALAVMLAVAETKDEYRPVKHFIEVVLTIIAASLLVYVVVNLIADWGTFDWGLLIRSLLLPPFLTIGVMPYLLTLGLWAGYDSAFVWINHETKHRAVRWRARLALVATLRLRASLANRFRTYWARKITEAENLGDARKVAKEYLADLDRDAERAREAQERMERFAGVDGVDELGERLDQREFTETKNALQRLASMQMGWYRNRGGRYRADVLPLLRADGLPDEHGIQLFVRSNGQAWWAWRRTITGWCFAIGAAEDPPDQWLYDGPEPPTGFPGQDPAWGQPWGIDANNW